MNMKRGAMGTKWLVTRMHKLLSRAMAKGVIASDLIDDCT